MKKQLKHAGLGGIYVRTAWVRFKIVRPKGRRLRVLIYARYSTDEQNPRSIEDQVEYCKAFLHLLQIEDYDLVVLRDEGISGELIDRPGIKQAREGISRQAWDLLVFEDSSRLFRNAPACMEFALEAVDNEIRFISINDQIDSCEPDWEDRLYEAARHHQRSNLYVSRRIVRAHEALWAMGAAIGLPKPGYRRVPMNPAAPGQPQKGPYFDEADPEQGPLVFKAYERIAVGESSRCTADWLTSVGLRKTSNSKSPVWTAKNVIDLIRRTDHRGYQTHRATVVEKKRKSGKKKTKKNNADNMLTRTLEQLRIVPDSLWYAANKVIDERDNNKNMRDGYECPLAGIPRDSRTPLSDILFCWCCRHKMYLETGYRCSQIDNCRCWNKASANPDLVHEVLYNSVIELLSGLTEELQELCGQATAALGDVQQVEVTRAELRARQQELSTQISRLNRALVSTDEPPESTVQLLNSLEVEQAEISAALQGLDDLQQQSAPPTLKELKAQVAEIVASLQSMDRSARDTLKELVGKIFAVPFLQYYSNKVVLRARFTIRMAALLPSRVRVALASRLNGSIDEHFVQMPLLVNLFKPSTGPAYGLAAVQLVEGNRSANCTLAS